MRPIVFPLASLTLALAACSSSYHPEYHPVTVSNFSQNIAYPVSVNGTTTIERPTTYVVPGTPPPLALPAEAVPPDFFK